MGNPLTDALGFTGQQTPNLIAPEKISQFDSPFGTSTTTGYTAAADPNQPSRDLSRQGLEGILAGGLQATPERLQQFQDAYAGARSPALERDLSNQAQQQAIQTSTQGTAGSSADLYSKALQDMFANEQRSRLRNESITGRENLADRALQQALQQANLFQGVEQQGFSNKLAGFGATQDALQGGQQAELGYANALNQNELARVGAENAAKTAGVRNVIGAGVAGAGAYNAFK